MKTNVKIMLDDGAYMPIKAHEADAGWDLKTPVDFEVMTGKPAIIDTGVHIQIPYGYVGFLKSKSGLNVKCNINGEGVIDSGYTGSIVVKLYYHGDTHGAAKFSAGDKIIQLVLIPILDAEFVLTDNFEETERGTDGFGSSGR